jgi:hypothetical protein
MDVLRSEHGDILNDPLPTTPPRMFSRQRFAGQQV